MSNDAWDAHDEAYGPRVPPTGAEVLAACEVLLYAGYTEEALSILARTVGDREGLRKVLTEGMAHG